jgi:hypothetical protein
MLPPIVLIILRTNLFHAVIFRGFIRICNYDPFKTSDEKSFLQKRHCKLMDLNTVLYFFAVQFKYLGRYETVSEQCRESCSSVIWLVAQGLKPLLGVSRDSLDQILKR